MQFVILEEQEFREFAERHPQKTFFQTPEIAHLREKNGWTIYYVGVKKDNQLVAATLLMSILEYKNLLEFYAPRGFLIDYNDIDLLSFFTTEIKHFITTHHGFILRIDPYLLKQERDSDGNIIKNGKNNFQAIQNLKQLGYIEKEEEEQIKWMYSIDLEGKTSDELFQTFRTNTKRSIQKTRKIGVEIQELTYDELHLLKEITEKTSVRKGFENKPLIYFQDMYHLFIPRKEVKFLLASIDLDHYLELLQAELENWKKELEKTKKEGLKKSLMENIQRQKEKKEEIKKLKEDKGNIIHLSASMFMLTGDEVIYLIGGNDEAYMNFNGQYALQWHMIEYALTHGYKKYNFYGIRGDFDTFDGVYEFKRGFHGYVEELIGEYELPITKHYYAYKRNVKMKKKIKKWLKRK